MVRAVENWADLHGTVEAIDVVEEPAGFVVVSIRVDDVAPVGELPNLFEGAEGSVEAVRVRSEVADRAGLATGRRVMCRARRASLDVSYANPEEIRIDPG